MSRDIRPYPRVGVRRIFVELVRLPGSGPHARRALRRRVMPAVIAGCDVSSRRGAGWRTAWSPGLCALRKRLSLSSTAGDAPVPHFFADGARRSASGAHPHGGAAGCRMGEAVGIRQHTHGGEAVRRTGGSAIRLSGIWRKMLVCGSLLIVSTSLQPSGAAPPAVVVRGSGWPAGPAVHKSHIKILCGAGAGWGRDTRRARKSWRKTYPSSAGRLGQQHCHHGPSGSTGSPSSSRLCGTGEYRSNRLLAPCPPENALGFFGEPALHFLRFRGLLVALAHCPQLALNAAPTSCTGGRAALSSANTVANSSTSSSGVESENVGTFELPRPR